MAITSRTSDVSKAVPGRFRKLAFKELGADTAVEVTLLRDGEYRIEPIPYDTLTGRRQIAERHVLEFEIPDILAPNTGQFVNDLVTKAIRWVQIVYLDGTTVTIDSGADGEAAFHFTKEFRKQGEVNVWRITGERIKSVEPAL